MKFRILIYLIIFQFCTDALSAADIYWFLAASMSKPGREITTRYNQESKASQVRLIIGGSGQLLSKIELTQQGGLYTPASTGFMKKATQKKLTRHYRPLLEQIPVFGLSSGASKAIQSFDDLQKKGVRLAVGNPKTMALGATYLKIEQKMGSAITGHIRKNVTVHAMNILQIVNYLKTDTIDAGTVFESVARSNKLDFISIPKHYNHLNTAYLIRLSTRVENEEEVSRFEQFILNQDPIFRRYGFNLLP